MPRKQSAVEASLKIKGFKKTSGDHRYFTYHSLAGMKTAVFTKTSHSAPDLSDSLLGMMSKQCKLSTKNFGLLIDCPLTRIEYEKLLVASNCVAASQPASMPAAIVPLPAEVASRRAAQEAAEKAIRQASGELGDGSLL